MRKLIFTIGFISVLSGCSSQDSWTAFYYPDKNDLEFFTKQSGFINLEACIDYGHNTSMENGASGFIASTYKCGKNCVFGETPDQYSCEDIINKEL